MNEYKTPEHLLAEATERIEGERSPENIFDQARRVLASFESMRKPASERIVERTYSEYGDITERYADGSVYERRIRVGTGTMARYIPPEPKREWIEKLLNRGHQHDLVAVKATSQTVYRRCAGERGDGPECRYREVKIDYCSVREVVDYGWVRTGRWTPVPVSPDTPSASADARKFDGIPKSTPFGPKP